MAVATGMGTLTVNAAFLQEIKDCNHELWLTVHAVRQLCDSDEPRGRIARQLVRLLDNFRDQLAMQFALEESYGYMACGPEVAPAPSISERAKRLCEQHCALYLRLTELCEQAEELQYSGMATARAAELIAHACDFERRLREHEQAEAELIANVVHDLPE
jgi:hypothetical protein